MSRDNQSDNVPSSAKPVDLHLDRKQGLTVTWGDGTKSHYTLAYLRKRCPCATCRAEREREQPAKPSMSLNVLPANIDKATEFVHAQVVGNYAIQIDWADGHRTGIYDFQYLRMIAPEEGADART